MIHLSTTGFKAADVDVELPSLAFLCAPNRAGKTHLADGAAWIILGHVPRLGKTEAITAQLMRGSEMSGTLAVGGRVITRSLRHTEDGYVGKVTCSWIDSRKSSEHAAAALTLFGADEREIAEGLWIDGLLKSTPNQRGERLQGLLQSASDPAALATAALREAARRLARLPADEVPDQAKDVKALIVKTPAGALQYAMLEQAGPMLVGKLRETDVLGAIAWVNEEKRRAAALVKPKSEARREYAQRLEALAPGNPAEQTRLETLRTKLDEQTGAAEERHTRIEHQRKAAAEAASELTAAETAARVAEEERESFEQHLPDLRAKEERLAATERTLAELAAPVFTEDAGAVELEREAEQLEAAAAEIVLPDVPDTLLLQARVTECRSRLSVAQGSDWAAVLEIAKRLDAIPVRISSPVGKIKDYVAALRELATRALGHDEPEQLRTELKHFEAELATARADLTECTRARDDATRHQRDQLQQARDKRAEASRLRAIARRKYEDAGAAHLARKRELNTEAATLRQALRALAERDKRSGDALVESVAQLRAARQRIKDLGPTPDLEPATDLTSERAKVAAELKLLTDTDAVRGDLARLVSEIEQLEARQTVYAALEMALRKVNEQEITRQSAGLLEPVATFLKAAGFTETPYLHGAELGWLREGKAISITAMSNSEWTLFAAAIAASVIRLRDPQVKILCVEAESMDDDTLGRLLRGLPAITSDFTSVVVLTPPTNAIVPAAWTRVALGAREAAAA